MKQIDNYEIVEKIGEGGMGEVYKGRDVMLEREVAIKMLRPELSNRDDIVQRFRSEAIALGRLNHGNIAAVYNFGRFNDQYYMALEFINGATLDNVIKANGPLPWRVAVRYAIAILDGLAHAHSFNIIHRDIKPSNIIISDHDIPKILDFGIARILEKARLTRSGHLVGTLEYVSPEQLQGKDTDARADIYSTGAVLYEMLTGHLPFERDTEYDLIKSKIEDKPQPLKTLTGAIPAALDKLVLKALEKLPEKRFSGAAEFGRELARLLDQPDEKSSSSFVAPTSENRFIKFCTDYPVLVLLIVSLLAGTGYVVKELTAPAKEPNAVNRNAAIVADAPLTVQEKPVNALAAKQSGLEPVNPPSIDYLPPPRDMAKVETPEPAPVTKTEPARQVAKTEISPQDRVKKNQRRQTTRKKPKRSVPSDPHIDDWAKEFFN